MTLPTIILGIVGGILFFNPELILDKLPQNEWTKKASEHHKFVALGFIALAVYMYTDAESTTTPTEGTTATESTRTVTLPSTIDIPFDSTTSSSFGKK
ncbi:hypothetical protein EBU95_05410 [bacterium]|nr:hypothetical protein [bacterium]